MVTENARMDTFRMVGVPSMSASERMGVLTLFRMVSDGLLKETVPTDILGEGEGCGAGLGCCWWWGRGVGSGGGGGGGVVLGMVVCGEGGSVFSAVASVVIIIIKIILPASLS